MVQTLDADGSLDRGDMMQILLAVGDEDGVVDATEFNDLNSLLANASTFHIPGYVQVLAADVINGNPANASYQGAPLGNLTPGSSATKLHLLVDKWFLGTDHPATSYAYQSFAGSLFVNNATYTDMHQGGLGDCYLIASLGALAKSSSHMQFRICSLTMETIPGPYGSTPAALRTTSRWTVTCRPPTVARFTREWAGASYTNSGNELWIALAEKAYAQWNETGKEGRVRRPEQL